MDAHFNWYCSQICHMKDIPVNLANMLWTISILSLTFNNDLESIRKKLLHGTSTKNGEVMSQTMSIKTCDLQL